MIFSSALSALPLRRFYKYVVKRLIGNFLKKDLDIDQFDVSVQLKKGVLHLRDLELDVRALNDDLQNSPFKFVDGTIGSLRLDIPWANLLVRSCQISVEDVNLTIAGRLQVPKTEAEENEAKEDAEIPPARRQFNLSMRRDKRNEEGIETLARLVKHILSNMEVEVKNIRISILSELEEGTPTVICFSTSSLQVMRGQTTSRLEKRRCDISGIDVHMIPVRLDRSSSVSGISQIRNLSTDSGSLILSTKSDTVHTIEVNKGRVEDPDSVYLQPAELHFDIKVVVQNVKLTIGQAQIGQLLDFVDGLKMGVDEIEDEATEKQTGVGKKDFWYDLYVMFEKHDSMVNDDMDDTPEDSPTDDGEEDDMINFPFVEGPTELPIATRVFSINVNIVKTSVFVVLSDQFEWKFGEIPIYPHPLDCMWNHVQFCIGKTDLNTELTLGPPSDTPPPEPSLQIDFGVCDAYVHERIKSHARNSKNAHYCHDGRISLPWKTADEREELEDLFYAALSDDFDSDDFRTLYEDDGDSEIHSILETEEDIWNGSAGEMAEDEDEDEDEHSCVESGSVLSRKEEKRNYDKASLSSPSPRFHRAVDDETASSATHHSQASLKAETNNDDDDDDDGDDDGESQSICTREKEEHVEDEDGVPPMGVAALPSRMEERNDAASSLTGDLPSLKAREEEEEEEENRSAGREKGEARKKGDRECCVNDGDGDGTSTVNGDVAYSCVDPHESLFENNWISSSSSSSTAWRLKRVLGTLSHHTDEKDTPYSISTILRSNEVAVTVHRVEVFLCRPSVNILSALSIKRAERTTVATATAAATTTMSPRSPRSLRSGAGGAGDAVAQGIKVSVRMPKIVVDVNMGDPRGDAIRVIADLSDVAFGRGTGDILWSTSFGPLNVDLHGSYEPMKILSSTDGMFRVIQREKEEEEVKEGKDSLTTATAAASAAPSQNTPQKPDEDDQPLIGWTKISMSDRPMVNPRGKRTPLEQFRKASNTFLWPNANLRRQSVSRRSSKSKMNKFPGPAPVPEVPPKESDRCDIECELHVPRVNFRLTAEALLELKEGITSFTLPYGDSASTPSAPSTTSAPKMAFMVSVDSLWYEVVEPTDEDPLHLHLSKLRCRYVGGVGKLGLLGKDLRLLRAKTLEEVVHPWYSYLRSSTKPGEASNSSLPLVFPTEEPGAHVPPFDLFSSLDDQSWQQHDCMCIRLDQKVRAGAVHSHLGFEVNGLLWRQSPELIKVYIRLMEYLNLPVSPVPETKETKARDRATFSVYHIGLKSCLFDIPGAWRPEDEIGAFASKAKGIIHLEDCDFSMGSLYGQLTQGVKVNIGSINGFIIDNVEHLLTQTLNCVSHTPPTTYLSSLGYAHVVSVKQMKFVWKGKGATKEGERNKNTFTTSVEHCGVHLCSDTVQCLLNLITAVPDPEEANKMIPKGVTSREGTMIREGDDGIEWDDPEVLVSPPPSRPSTPMSGRILIEDYIQLQEPYASPAVAVGGASSSSSRAPPPPPPPPRPPPPPPPPPPSSPQVEIELMEDHLGDAGSPSCSAGGFPDLLLNTRVFDEKEFDFQEDVDSSTPGEPEVEARADKSDINLCLMDPEIYTKDKIEALYVEEDRARKEIKEMFPEKTEVTEDLPTRETIHQAGSSATWFVEPKNLKIINDHLVSWGNQIAQGGAASSSAPKKKKPDLWDVRVEVSEFNLCVYAGTDFLDDSYGKFQPWVQNDQEPPPNRLNRRLKNQSLELKLQSTIINATGLAPVEDVADGTLQFNRHFSLIVKDFTLLDRVQSSVFQHVAAYWEEDEFRPRSTTNNMVQVYIEDHAVPENIEESRFPRSSRTEEETPKREYYVDVRILPLRVTIDQDTVEFFMSFLHRLTLPHYIEVDASTADFDDGTDDDESQPKECDIDIIELKEVNKDSGPSKMGGIRLQQVTISALLLSIDYRAKRLDMAALRRGEAWQLCNLLPLIEGLEVCFSKTKLKRINGFGHLTQELFQLWNKDIDRAQILRAIMGVTPIRSLANIGASMTDLVREPLSQYFKRSDNRSVSQGFLRCFASSLRNITVETISLTENVFVNAQNVLEFVETSIGPEAQPSSRARRIQRLAPQATLGPSRESVNNLDDPQGTDIAGNWCVLEPGSREFIGQPKTAQEGLMLGLDSLHRSIKTMGKAVQTPVVELRHGCSTKTVLTSVAKGIPVMILRPVIGVSSCAATTLRGVKNHVDGKRRLQALGKYKGPSDGFDDNHF